MDLLEYFLNLFNIDLYFNKTKDIIFLIKDILFYTCLISGLISIKVYDLIIPNQKRSFSKSIYDIIVYGILNIIVVLIFLNILYMVGFNKLISIVIISGLIFILPVCWPIILLKFLKIKIISQYIVNPIKKPWDYIFNKRKVSWVIITLKNGTRIGGEYSSNSFSSSYPEEEEIFLERIWNLKENGSFDKVIEGSQGILIWGRDILTIEFK